MQTEDSGASFNVLKLKKAMGAVKKKAAKSEFYTKQKNI